MAPHSSPLAWKIPWAEEPGRLQSMGSPRVGNDWATSLSLFTFMHWRRKWQPTPVFLENLRDGGAWWAAVYGVTQSRTRLKWLSSSSRGKACYHTDGWVPLSSPPPQSFWPSGCGVGWRIYICNRFPGSAVGAGWSGTKSFSEFSRESKNTSRLP